MKFDLVAYTDFNNTFVFCSFDYIKFAEKNVLPVLNKIKTEFLFSSLLGSEKVKSPTFLVSMKAYISKI